MQAVDTFLDSLAAAPLVPGLTVLAAFAAMVALVLGMRRQTRRPQRRHEPNDLRTILRAGPTPPRDDRDVATSLAKVRLELRPLLDREEIRIAPFLDRAVRDFGRGHRLAMQVPAAMLLHPRHGAASTERNQNVAAALDQRRITFAVLDRQSRLATALFVGAGPEPLLAEALRLAGVPVVVLNEDWTPEQLKARLRESFAIAPVVEAEPLLTALTGRKPGR
jgi:hypothetical protein